MRAIRAAAVVGVVLLLAAPSVQGKDLAGRIGVGFNTQLATVFSGPGSIATTSTQALSGKYWFTNVVGVQALVGFNTWRLDRQTNYDVGTGAKFLFNLVQEENLNFFLDAGGGLLFVGHEDDRGKLKNDLGFSVLTGGGIEWFFQGLPNLGFDVEVGVQYSYVGEYTRIGSYGDAFGTFGVHYYF